MADITRTVDIIFRGDTRQLGGSINSIESELGGIGGEADQAGREVDGLGDEIEGLGGAPLLAVRALGVAIATWITGEAVGAFIDANVQVEKFTRGMTLLTGSSEEAGEEFAYIVGLARILHEGR